MKQEERELWRSSIGTLIKIPKSQTESAFSWKDIVRFLIIMIIFSIAFFYWFGYWGLFFSLILTILIEVYTYKNNNGLLQCVTTGEIFPLYRSGIWETINTFINYLLSIFFFIDLILIFREVVI